MAMADAAQNGRAGVYARGQLIKAGFTELQVIGHAVIWNCARTLWNAKVAMSFSVRVLFLSSVRGGREAAGTGGGGKRTGLYRKLGIVLAR